jgi:hypothetical protein
MTHSCTPEYIINESRICKKQFSKPASNKTYCENNSGYILKRGVDDQFVVSYNYSMINNFKAHINVIVAQDLAVVLYIYKYIYKG